CVRQAALDPHRQDGPPVLAVSHHSPAAQQVVPQRGPSRQPSDGRHDPYVGCLVSASLERPPSFLALCVSAASSAGTPGLKSVMRVHPGYATTRAIASVCADVSTRTC